MKMCVCECVCNVREEYRSIGAKSTERPIPKTKATCSIVCETKMEKKFEEKKTHNCDLVASR